ncbi:MAG TPA: FxSxx-COOH system tetratricopeptide repeat protein, partial [Ktedonobacteraceae bacterium]
MKAKIERHPNEALRRERLRRHWTQQELAEQLGTTIVTISHWEGGLSTPGPHFSQLLCNLFEKSPEALGLLHEAKEEIRKDASTENTSATDDPTASLASPVATTAPLWSVPYRRNLFFTGREQMLTSLHTALQARQTVASTYIQAISGLGGIGKTQSALEYAYRFRDQYQAVLWARAETSDVLLADMVSLAEVLDLPEKGDQGQQQVVKAVKRWLSQHTDWLLILDNVEDINLISDFLSFEVNGHVLLTIRTQAVGTLAQRIDLEPMEEEEGTLFLLRRAKLLAPDAPLEEIDEAQCREARKVYQLMGGLPLALDQAGAYIESSQCSLSDYLRFLQSSQLRLLAERDECTDHPLSVSRTFALTFERLEREHPSAAAFLTVCAYLAPEAIPETFFLEGAAYLGPTLETLAVDPLQFNSAVRALLSYSLLQRDARARTVTVHRLVQAVLKGRLPETEQRTWTARVLHAMAQLFPSEDTHIDYWQTCERLLPHALVCITLGEQWEADKEQRIMIMSHVAMYLLKRAQYLETDSLLQRALLLGEQVLGSENPQYAAILHRLAESHREQGKFEQAEPLFQRALRIREQTLGTEHPLVAESLTRLGILYRRQGKFEQAEPLFLRALQIYEQALGSEHPQLAFPLYGLGNLYQEQGKFEQAELSYLRSLHIREQALGSEHPQLAFPLYSLGNLYQEQGKFEQAESLLQQALHIREQALGSEHPQLAFPLYGLGSLYQKQGKFEQAELLYLRSLLIREQALGSEHPQLAYSFYSLGNLYQEQGKFEQAESSLQRALLIWEQALGSEHPLLAHPLLRLANLHREQEQYEQARSLYQRALVLLQQHPGSQHPDIAKVLHDFARFYQVQQQMTEALSLYQQALAIRKQILG